MTVVKIKNKIIILCILHIVTVGCRSVEKKIDILQIKNKNNSLVINANLNSFGSSEINEINWENNSKDSVAYFYFNLKNIKTDPFFIKTHLIATNIPFKIEYKKLTKDGDYDRTKLEYININIIHQFNTIYIDSLIFKVKASDKFPVLEKAYQVGYQKVGGRSLCVLPFKRINDTLDISNPKNKRIVCVQSR